VAASTRAPVPGFELPAVPLEKHRLVVEQIHLARAAVHEQLDHALGAGR
jgi:mitochondrial fission protein ELM1